MDAGNLLLDPQFLLLETGKGRHVGHWALAFFGDPSLEARMLGLKSRYVRLVHSDLLHSIDGGILIAPPAPVAIVPTAQPICTTSG